jgi:hypothetical protein
MLHRVTWCVFLLLTSVSAAETPKEQFDKTFAAKIKAVHQTGTKTDDLKLGRALFQVASVEENAEQLKLQVATCYDLCAKTPDGFNLAIDAMLVLAEVIESKRIESLNYALVVQKKQYFLTKSSKRDVLIPRYLHLLDRLVSATRAVGAIDDAIRHTRRAIAIAKSAKSDQLDYFQMRYDKMQARESAARKAAILEKKVLAEPNNAEARRDLIRLYVGAVGDVARARKLLTPSMDEELRCMVPLAATTVNALTPASALELAMWYQRLIPSMPKNALMRIETEQLVLYNRGLSALTPGSKEHTSVQQTIARLRSTQLTGRYAAWVAAPRIDGTVDATLRRVIAKARTYLWNAQNKDGMWSAGENPHQFGPYTTTSLVILALLDGGVRADDKRLAAPLAKIMAMPNKNTLYNAMSVLVLLRAGKMDTPEGSVVIRQRIRRLLLSTSDTTFDVDSTATTRVTDGSMFETFWACWAISAARDAGVLVPAEFFSSLLRKCRMTQKGEGGWSYLSIGGPSHVPTVMRTLLAMVAMEKLGNDQKVTANHSVVRKGQAWIDGQFNNGKNDDPMVYLFLLTRLGLANQSIQFGKTNWFDYMSIPLAKRQQRDGSWIPREKSPLISAAFGLMALQSVK